MQPEGNGKSTVGAREGPARGPVAPLRGGLDRASHGAPEGPAIGRQAPCRQGPSTGRGPPPRRPRQPPGAGPPTVARSGGRSGSLTGVDRPKAIEFVRSKAEKETTVRHLISVEGVMRRLAEHFGEDPERWGLVGLFHDIDQDQTHDDPPRHAYVGAEWLREAGVDEEIVNGVLAHAHAQYRTDLMSKAIVPADAVSGLLVACALVRPEKTGGMKVSSCKKKLKEKSFAPGVNRDEIYECEQTLEIPLDEFLRLGIEGLQAVAPEIELAS